MAAMHGKAAIYNSALWAGPRFLWNGSASMHQIEKRSADNNSGITRSVKLTNYGRAGVSRLGGGTWKVYLRCAGIVVWLERRQSESQPFGLRTLLEQYTEHDIAVTSSGPAEECLKAPLGILHRYKECTNLMSWKQCVLEQKWPEKPKRGLISGIYDEVQ